MTLRLYTDASTWSGSSSYGYVLFDGDKELRRGGGMFKQGQGNTTLAELYAIANSIHQVKRHGWTARHPAMLVLSDCQSVVLQLQNGKPGNSQRASKLRDHRAKVREAIEVLQALGDGLALTFDWVKGHQPHSVNSPDALGNRIANEMARKSHGPLQKQKAKDREARKLRKQRQREAAGAPANGL